LVAICLGPQDFGPRIRAENQQTGLHLARRLADYRCCLILKCPQITCSTVVEAKDLIIPEGFDCYEVKLSYETALLGREYLRTDKCPRTLEKPHPQWREPFSMYGDMTACFRSSLVVVFDSPVSYADSKLRVEVFAAISSHSDKRTSYCNSQSILFLSIFLLLCFPFLFM